VLHSIMPLTLTLDSHGEQLVSAHLRSGLYHSPEEVVNPRAWRPSPRGNCTRRPRGRCRRLKPWPDIRELRKGVTLGGLRIKDLVDEGRKYDGPGE